MRLQDDVSECSCRVGRSSFGCDCNNISNRVVRPTTSPPPLPPSVPPPSSSSSTAAVASNENIMRTVPADVDCRFQFNSRIAFNHETGQQLTVLVTHAHTSASVAGWCNGR